MFILLSEIVLLRAQALYTSTQLHPIHLQHKHQTYRTKTTLFLTNLKPSLLCISKNRSTKQQIYSFGLKTKSKKFSTSRNLPLSSTHCCLLSWRLLSNSWYLPFGRRSITLMNSTNQFHRYPSSMSKHRCRLLVIWKRSWTAYSWILMLLNSRLGLSSWKQLQNSSTKRARSRSKRYSLV